MNFRFIFPTLLLGTLLLVSAAHPTASTVFAIKGGIPNGGNSANAPSPNDQALAQERRLCVNMAGNPNQPPFCVTDSDGDTSPDIFDPCPFDPTDTCIPPTDSDGDGIPDIIDNCPFDPNNTCPPPDIDNDGIPDRSDPCPLDPNNTCTPIDIDNDGIPDHLDQCPFDPTNTCNDDTE